MRPDVTIPSLVRLYRGESVPLVGRSVDQVATRHRDGSGSVPTPNHGPGDD